MVTLRESWKILVPENLLGPKCRSLSSFYFLLRHLKQLPWCLVHWEKDEKGQALLLSKMLISIFPDAL